MKAYAQGERPGTVDLRAVRLSFHFADQLGTVLGRPEPSPIVPKKEPGGYRGRETVMVSTDLLLIVNRISMKIKYGLLNPIMKKKRLLGKNLGRVAFSRLEGGKP